MTQRGQALDGGRHKKTHAVVQKIAKGGLTRLNECHTFAWSRSLWRTAARQMTAWTAAIVVCYLGVASWGMHYDGLRGWDIPYFLACTLSTVGPR